MELGTKILPFFALMFPAASLTLATSMYAWLLRLQVRDLPITPFVQFEAYNRTALSVLPLILWSIFYNQLSNCMRLEG